MNGAKRASLTVGVALLMILPAVIWGGPVYGERPASVESAARQAPVPQCIGITSNSVGDVSPAVAYNNVRDEFLVVWGHESGPDSNAIYGQRVSRTGSLVGGAIVIDAVGWNGHPDVAYDPSNDQYLVVYYYDVGPDDADIHGRLVQGNGSLPGSAVAIDASKLIQVGARVAYNSQNHEYLVVYHTALTGGYQVVGKRLASDASVLDTNPTAIGGISSAWPDVAYNPTRNQYLVTYPRWNSDSYYSDIYAQMVSHELDMLGKEFGVCVHEYPQSDPAIAAGPDGFFIAWDDMRSGPGVFQTHGRRLLGNGHLMGPDGGFPIGRTSDDDTIPAVAYGPNYAYLVAFSWTHEEPTAATDDIRGAYVIPGTDEVAGSAFDIDATAPWQDFAAVACAPTGDCLVAEQESDPDWEIKACFLRLNRSFAPLALSAAP